MVKWWERLKVRVLVFFSWGLSRKRLLASLRLFAATEDDSAWQLRYAAERVDDPEQRADLFGQILEERHHACLFTRLHDDLGPRRLVPARYERKPLFARKEEMDKFVVYCLVGEKAAAERFSNIQACLGDGPLKEVLKSILRDEAGHVHGAGEMIEAGSLPPAEVRSLIRRIVWKRRWEAWLRAGRNVSDVISTVILSALYFVIAPFCARPARRKLTTKEV